MYRKAIAFLLGAMLLAGCENKNEQGAPRATAVVLSRDGVELLVGEKVSLTAHVLPRELNMGVEWSVVDPDLASVVDGTVTAVAEGVTYVVATSKDGAALASCMVSVNPPVHYKVSITDADGVDVNGIYGWPSASYDLKVSSSDGEQHNYEWTISDDAVAEVKDGKVTLKYPSGQPGYLYYGRANLSVKSEDGYGCQIPVVSNIVSGLLVDGELTAAGSVYEAVKATQYSLAAAYYDGENNVVLPRSMYALSLSNTADFTLSEEDGSYSLLTADKIDVRTKISIDVTGGKNFELLTVNVPKSYAIKASFVEASSSTLIYSWTEGVSVSDDISKTYTISLYRDEACSDLVQSFDIPAGSGCWNGKQPQYIFARLLPATSYWLKVIDTTDGDSKESDVIEGKTTAFSHVQMPVSITTTGVILAEDFGELCWDSDYILQAAGFRPTSRTDFSIMEAASFAKPGEGSEITLSGQSEALPESRLASWATDSNVYIHPGFLKLGTASGKGWILTPQIPVPEGKTATARVTLTACRYNSSQSSKWAVAVLTPTEANVSGFKADFSWPAKVGGSHVSTNYQEIEITNTASWVTYTVEGLVITPAARIAFGAYDGAGSSVCRACISDIKLEITEIK